MRNRTYMLHCKMVIELRYEILCSDYMLSGFSNFADQHPLLLFVMCFFFFFTPVGTLEYSVVISFPISGILAVKGWTEVRWCCPIVCILDGCSIEFFFFDTCLNEFSLRSNSHLILV